MTQPIEDNKSWRTWKRVMPLDVYEEIKRFEELVAEHSGLPPRYEGIGPSVSVWTIITEHLRDSEAQLIALAREWNDKR